jgi:hypothetical protein
MLFITNIDDCNFSMRGSFSPSGLKVLGKKEFTAKACEPVYNEVCGRVNVFNINNGEALVRRKPVNEITLNGTVYATPQEFVVAFDALMNLCCCADNEVATTEEATTTGIDGELLTNENDEILLTNETGEEIILN